MISSHEVLRPPMLIIDDYMVEQPIFIISDTMGNVF